MTLSSLSGYPLSVWYETGEVSQGRAAEIAGVSRAEFLDALARFGVTPFQVTDDELVAEWKDA